eukprot:12407834-Karenia_brevis.AAC.1
MGADAAHAAAAAAAATAAVWKLASVACGNDLYNNILDQCSPLELAACTQLFLVNHLVTNRSI